MDVDAILEQTQWDTFWMPPDCRIIDRPELQYSVCPRDVESLNIVTRVRAPDAELPRLFDEVAAAHAGVSSRVLVVPGNRTDGLIETLGAHGYSRAHEHDAFSLDVGSYEPREAPPGVIVRPVRTRQDVEGAYEAARRAFDNDTTPERTEDELKEHLRRCTMPGARVVRVVAWERGRPVGSGGFTIYPKLKFGFLWAGCVVPEARGRGIYSAVLTARVREAKRRGLRQVGLYARLDTSAPIVANQGFERHGRMEYWDHAAARKRIPNSQ